MRNNTQIFAEIAHSVNIFKIFTAAMLKNNILLVQFPVSYTGAFCYEINAHFQHAQIKKLIIFKGAAFFCNSVFP